MQTRLFVAAICIAVIIFYTGTIAITDYFDNFYYCKGQVYFSSDWYGILLSLARFISVYILSLTLDYFFRFTFQIDRISIDSHNKKDTIEVDFLKQSFKDNARKDFLINQFVY